MTNILAFSQAKIPSALIGVVNPISALCLKEENLDFIYKTSVEIIAEDIMWADVIICIRGTEPLEKEIISQARKVGRYIVYYLDDDLLNVPKESVSSSYFSSQVVKNNIIDIIEMSDCFWTNNQNIAQKYSDKSKHIIISNLYYDIKVSHKEKDEFNCNIDKNKTVKIGFAGSIDHTKYIDELLGETIKEVSEKYRDKVEFIFFGAKPEILDTLKLKHIPYESNYENYLNSIIKENLDLAIAPLIDSEFHKCKFYNKYMEYSALGIPAIYSKVQPYTFVVEDMENGLLAENTKESWESKLTLAIEDESLREKIIENAQKHIQENFSQEKVINEIKDKINCFINYKSPKINLWDIENFPTNQRLDLTYRIKRIISIHGYRTPIFIVQKILTKIKFKL